jgi:hypothetical protein
VQAGLSNTVRVSLGALFILSGCGSTLAQKSPLDELVHRMADSLAQSKQKSVAVFAFVAPDDAEALGQKLAGDFQLALVKSRTAFEW